MCDIFYIRGVAGYLSVCSVTSYPWKCRAFKHLTENGLLLLTRNHCKKWPIRQKTQRKSVVSFIHVVYHGQVKAEFGG